MWHTFKDFVPRGQAAGGVPLVHGELASAFAHIIMLYRFYMAIVRGVGPKTTVMREKAFGPVIRVTPASSDDEAVAIANSTRYGLTDQVYSRDLDAARRIAARLAAAQVGINTCARRGDLLFGGTKAGGLGRSGGTYALASYTKLRATVHPAD